MFKAQIEHFFAKWEKIQSTPCAEVDWSEFLFGISDLFVKLLTFSVIGLLNPFGRAFKEKHQQIAEGDQVISAGELKTSESVFA